MSKCLEFLDVLSCITISIDLHEDGARLERSDLAHLVISRGIVLAGEALAVGWRETRLAICWGREVLLAGSEEPFEQMLTVSINIGRPGVNNSVACQVNVKTISPSHR